MWGTLVRTTPVKGGQNGICEAAPWTPATKMDGAEHETVAGCRKCKHRLAPLPQVFAVSATLPASWYAAGDPWIPETETCHWESLLSVRHNSRCGLGAPRGGRNTMGGKHDSRAVLTCQHHSRILPVNNDSHLAKHPVTKVTNGQHPSLDCKLLTNDPS